MTEEWRPVVGWEGWYSVSDAGRVRSEERQARTVRGVWTYKSRIRTPVHGRLGHQSVVLSKPGKSQSWLIHRLVLTAFVGPCPEGMESLHWDDDPSNNRLSNLRWGTRSDNLRDMVRNGRHWQRVKTHCPRGHELSGDNLVPSKLKNGIRQCLACSRDQSRRYARDRNPT